MWGVANLALTPSLINCLDHFLKWEMISCQRKNICRATALEAYPPHNGVLVWCSNTNNILLCVAPIRHSPRHHLWSFVHQVAINTLGTDISDPRNPVHQTGLQLSLKGVGEQIRPLFSIIQPLGPPSPSKPRCPPQGLGLPPTIWAAWRPPQESLSCFRAPQNHLDNHPTKNVP